MKPSRRLALCVSLSAALLVPLAAQAAQLTVSAAASLTNAFNEIGPLFEKATPDTTVQFNFAASGTLLQQITQGAPVDVFASADQATMDRAEAAKLIVDASRSNFVSNSLVLIEPIDSKIKLDSLDDLKEAAVKRLAIGKVETVPVGRYTQQVLQGAGLWDALASKMIPADSVRQVLDYVGRGEVDAGFVYATDAAVMADKVKVVLTPQGHAPVLYPIAVIEASSNKGGAQAFIDFLATEPAQAVLARYGFGKP